MATDLAISVVRSGRDLPPITLANDANGMAITLLRRSFWLPALPAAAQLRGQITAPPASLIDHCCPLLLARMWHSGRAKIVD
jgi:hypothetical protein